MGGGSFEVDPFFFAFLRLCRWLRREWLRLVSTFASDLCAIAFSGIHVSPLDYGAVSSSHAMSTMVKANCASNRNESDRLRAAIASEQTMIVIG